MNYNWEYLHDAEANPMYEEIADLIQKHDIRKVLDLGCGMSRWNEHMPKDYKYSVVGIDSNEEIVDACNQLYNGRRKNADAVFMLGDAWNPVWHGEVDAIVLSGFLYYAKPENGHNMMDFIDMVVEDYSPRYIIVQEPHPSVAHNSPDFIELFDRYGYTAQWFNLDIRMGRRRVYCLHTDRHRPSRKVKAQFVDNGANIKQPDFNLDRLRFGAYITNTENLDSERDGRILPSTDKFNTYVCVSAGYKGLIKGAVDWRFNKEFEYVWIDISPTALDYRMFVDSMMVQDPFADVERRVDEYVKTVEPRLQAHYGGGLGHKEMLDRQLEEVGLDRDDWQDFLLAYSEAPKSYVKRDLVNNVGMLYDVIKDKPNVWLWYSNAFDWHQFRHSEKSFEAWRDYLLSRKDDIELHGHTPPFTSSE